MHYSYYNHKQMNLEHFEEIAFQVCRLEAHLPVLVGVSGGPDSLCLLDCLSRVGFPVIAAHFDHQLRPGSRQDAEVVRRFALQRGASFVLGSQDVAGYAQQEKLSIEEAARTLRYRFLFEQARKFEVQAVAVGHTADDQVETIMMHMLRGTGLSGLAGMPFRTILPDWDPAIPLVRPLLDFWREDTLACCAERGLSPVEDETNRDPAFFRNRLRHELIPFLETFNPQARRLIWRTSQVLSGDVEIVRHSVDAAWRDCLKQTGPGWVSLLLEPFRKLLPGLQRGVLRRAIAQLTSARAQPAARDIDFLTVERALTFLRGAHPVGQIDLNQGLRLFVELDAVVIARLDAHLLNAWPQLNECIETSLAVPGKLALNGGWLLSSDWTDTGPVPSSLSGSADRAEAWLDADLLHGPLSIRCPKAGDRFMPLGMGGHSIKLSDFWINQKLPRRARAAWPLVVCAESIVWIPLFRPAHPFQISEGTRRFLHLRLHHMD